MWKKINVLIYITLAGLGSLSCEKEELLADKVSHHFYLRNEGADMPVTVEGNSASNVFLVILHGGPGGSAMRHYHQIPKFTDEMESKYALVYWEQRGSGMSSGNPKTSSLNLEQFGDDLDKLLTLLEHRYGNGIQFFLLGQSFGGILGSSYLVSGKAEGHPISGWISLSGAHGFKGYPAFVYRYAADFLDKNDDPAFDELRTKLTELDTAENSIDTQADANELGKELQEEARDLGLANKRQVEGIGSAFFFGNYNPVVAILNKENVNERLVKQMINLSLAESLRRATPPALYMCGQYDFVVPPTVGREAFENYGSSRKQYVTFERGTHNLLATHPEESKKVISAFIEAHRQDR